MRVALVNPPWSYDGSIYFGCRSPHLPLELGYGRAMLERSGHEVLLADGHLLGQTMQQVADEVAAFAPEMTVIATAPTYLFWRCAPPELRVPAEFLRVLNGRGGLTVAVGPHGSATPAATLRKLGVDIVVRGECEEVVAVLADREDRSGIEGISFFKDGDLQSPGPANASGFADHAPLRWPDEWIARLGHHHHRFDRQPDGPGAEVEASRGCPYDCSFCAKIDYRDSYRRRNLDLLLEEIDGLIAQGVTYLYFVDEIFLPQRPLLEALVERPVSFGVQTRIDLWKPDLIELLGKAGCVSIEAGIESLTREGREALAKRCRLETEDLVALLIKARQHVPFVQGNLIGVAEDDPALVEYWRDHLQKHGVWANKPVPLYPYPSSPSYRALWGEPDDFAWERAHDYYLTAFQGFSDIQDDKPVPLRELEEPCCNHL
ncbi:MAG TPA: TIGR04295 family B12-binding domain-containing radical SAM protein [Ferrovibrio sp.]|uniref:TIGR04295 family B12-binding domain-containing radical SAM protein n=1 Tax=Ferrovibrio sp. TaxID=1917215 RepID=UPI002ED3071C